jgi:hypothetical protein
MEITNKMLRQKKVVSRQKRPLWAYFQVHQLKCQPVFETNCVNWWYEATNYSFPDTLDDLKASLEIDKKQQFL